MPGRHHALASQIPPSTAGEVPLSTKSHRHETAFFKTLVGLKMIPRAAE